MNSTIQPSWGWWPYWNQPVFDLTSAGGRFQRLFVSKPSDDEAVWLAYEFNQFNHRSALNVRDHLNDISLTKHRWLLPTTAGLDGKTAGCLVVSRRSICYETVICDPDIGRCWWLLAAGLRGITEAFRYCLFATHAACFDMCYDVQQLKLFFWSLYVFTWQVGPWACNFQLWQSETYPSGRHTYTSVCIYTRSWSGRQDLVESNICTAKGKAFNARFLGGSCARVPRIVPRSPRVSIWLVIKRSRRVRAVYHASNRQLGGWFTSPSLPLG